MYKEEIEATATELKTPQELVLDNDGHLIDILGNRSSLIPEELAEELVRGGYKRLSQMEKLARGRVSALRDAGEIVLKEGIYSDKDRERYDLVIAFRHVGQTEDISFFQQ